MKKFEFVLLFSVYCLIRYQLIESVCIISYPNDGEIAPIYGKFLGKYMVHLPYNGRDLYLSEGETIQGYCRTSFSSITIKEKRNNNNNYNYNYNYDYNNNNDRKKVFYNQSSITLHCVESRLRYENSILEETVLKCDKLKWSAYNTDDAYEWCEKNENTKTFLLATKSSEDHHILAGICFDLKNWSLQTITYNVTNSGSEINKEIQRDITKANLKAFQSLGDELSNLKSNYFGFTEADLQRQLKDLSLNNLWLNLANYELSSIIQGTFYKNYFNEFVETLNIIWWRNLRLGNWKNFMNALENSAYNNSFQLYVGTSGAVKIPSKHSTENTLKIKNFYLNETVPGYIWAYITSTDSQNEDFIIVGYNSPFAEWFDIKEVVFCPDICSQIPWLKEITSSFRYTNAGVMFCCSPDFIGQTNFLYGFPMDVLITRSVRNQENVSQIENTSNNSFNSTHLETTEQSHSETHECDYSTEFLHDE